MEKFLPSIPAKRYFTISEVGGLCGVKPHVLRYWEQEFTQLRPAKRRGNRRYYQLHEVELIRRIRELLYEQGFTIVGARNKLLGVANGPADDAATLNTAHQEAQASDKAGTEAVSESVSRQGKDSLSANSAKRLDESSESCLDTPRPLLQQVRKELLDIRNLLEPAAS